MSFLFNRRKNTRIPPSATFRLTQEGREKLQDFGGDPKSRILTALETQGTSNVEEISRYSGVHKGQIEKLLPGMIRGSYVQYVSASQGSDLE